MGVGEREKRPKEIRIEVPGKEKSGEDKNAIGVTLGYFGILWDIWKMYVLGKCI